MAYDSGYETEPIGGGNPYYRCVHCLRSEPDINGDVGNHSWHCKYRMLKQGYKLTWSQFDDLLDELDREDLQDLTSVVMANRAMENLDIKSALAHLSVDADKLLLVSEKLSSIIKSQEQS